MPRAFNALTLVAPKVRGRVMGLRGLPEYESKMRAFTAATGPNPCPPRMLRQLILTRQAASASW